MMKLIVITLEQIFDGEAQLINALFDVGLEILHLRKPNHSAEEVSCLLKQISSENYRKIVIHDHSSLLDSFDLRGVHLNRRNPQIPQKSGITVSRSCHTFEEVEEAKDRFDYLFLSPIFDSVSKVGYKQAFTTQDLMAAKDKGIIDQKVIALGGIMANNIDKVKALGFGGVAILGSLWGDVAQDKNRKELINRYKKLNDLCQESKSFDS